MSLMETDFLFYIIILEGIIIYLLTLKFFIEKKKSNRMKEEIDDAQKIINDILISKTIRDKEEK